MSSFISVKNRKMVTQMVYSENRGMEVNTLLAGFIDFFFFFFFFFCFFFFFFVLKSVSDSFRYFH